MDLFLSVYFSITCLFIVTFYPQHFRTTVREIKKTHSQGTQTEDNVARSSRSTQTETRNKSRTCSMSTQTDDTNNYEKGVAHCRSTLYVTLLMNVFRAYLVAPLRILKLWFQRRQILLDKIQQKIRIVPVEAILTKIKF